MQYNKLLIWSIALFLLIAPFVYSYGCPYIRNETFNSAGNWSLGTGCTITGGQLSCSNPTGQTKYYPALPNLSIDKSNFTVQMNIRFNSSADTTEHVMLCADNFTSASCGGGDGDQRRTGLRSGNTGVGIQVTSPAGVIQTLFTTRNTGWNLLRISVLTNLTFNWSVNITAKDVMTPFSTLTANVTQILITTGTYTMEIDNLTVRNDSAVCAAPPDITKPIVKTTFNVSTATVNTVANYTANITDETGLSTANWTVNLSTGTIKANYSISGTAKQISNTTSLKSCTETCVLNFTIYATDTNNNVKQNSTLLTVADITPPVVNTSLNVTSGIEGIVVNYTSNITDLNGLLSANWTVNLTTGTIYANYTLSGNSAQVSNVTTLAVAGIFNFTIYSTDRRNNVKQNSTLITVTTEAISVSKIAKDILRRGNVIGRRVILQVIE